MCTHLKIQQASAAILAGGVIAYPTEGVYGIGCLPDDPLAVDRILRIKGRTARQGLILVAPNISLLEPWIAPTEQELERLQRPVSKPTTWIVTAAPGISQLLSGGRDTLAVRISAHPIVAALCNASSSALVSTSANRSGHRAAKTALQARCWLGNLLDYVISAPLGGAAGPSEIRVAQSDQVIRPGS